MLDSGTEVYCLAKGSSRSTMAQILSNIASLPCFYPAVWLSASSLTSVSPSSPFMAELCHMVASALAVHDPAAAVLVIEPLCFLHERIASLTVESGSRPEEFQAAVLSHLLNEIFGLFVDQIRVKDNVPVDIWLGSEKKSSRFDNIVDHDHYNARENGPCNDESEFEDYCNSLAIFRYNNFFNAEF
jgi:hypothetical protein